MTSCPHELVTDDVWAMLDLVACADGGKGNLPVAGGLLDQTASYRAAARFVQVEESRVKARDRQEGRG